VPHCVLEIPPSPQRLERILDLVRRCPVSIHDLSRVQTSPSNTGRVPRFNMPFELGLACALRASGRRVFVMEEVPYRLQATLSDMNGHDPVIHGGRPDGVLRCVLDCLGRPRGNPTLASLRGVKDDLAGFARGLERDTGVGIFEPEPFRLLVTASAVIARRRGLIR
jgi:hypothetical protein